YGKSNLLTVLIHSLIDRARIGIIDLKRLQFSYLKNYCALAKKRAGGPGTGQGPGPGNGAAP
ncbi:MAG: hypothetical protein M1489_01875, partial [Firmicutes bacterium]|nr:hypothetical protein [Bacillota bacterium]